MACDVEWSSAKFVRLDEKLEDIVFALLEGGVVVWVNVSGYFVELLDNLSNLTLVDGVKDALTGTELVFSEQYALVNFFFLALFLHF